MIGLWLCSVLVASDLPEPDGTDLDALSRYFAEHSHGAIVRTDEPEPDHPFTMSKSRPWRLDGGRRWRPVRNQRLFSFDVERWIEAEGVTDLLAGKRRFYEEQEYDVLRQLHQQPYAYLEGWGALFHPPIPEITLPLERYHDLFVGEPAPPEDHPYFDPGFQVAIDEASGTVLTRGNTLEYLPDGEAFQAKLALAEGAQESLYGAVMYFACDKSSDELAEVLIEKAQSGVDVRLVIERVYRESFGRFCADRLKQGGVKILVVGDSMRLGSVGAVMHHKIWIRDGEQMILGGQNIVKDDNESTGLNYRNRDPEVGVSGPAVTDAMQRFVDLWTEYEGEGDVRVEQARIDARRAQEIETGMRGADNYAEWLSDPEQRTTGLCRVALQGTFNSIHPIAPMVAAHLDEAREQVVLTAPTLVVDDGDTWAARLYATLRDGPPHDPRIVVVTNGEGGGSGEVTGFMWRASLEFEQTGKRLFSKLLAQARDAMSRMTAAGTRAGAIELQRNPKLEVWTYVQYIHAKTWVFDRTAVMISSWNLDVQSADMNHEVAVVCMDDHLRGQVERGLTRDLVNSIPVVSANGR